MEQIRSISLSIFQNSEFLTLVFLSALILIVLYRIKPFLKDDSPRPQDTEFSCLRIPSVRRVHYSRNDRYVILAVSAIYGLISFHRLGSASMPVTTWQPSASPQSVIFELTGDTWFDKLVVFYGEGDNNARISGYQLGLHDIAIEGSNDLLEWQPIATLNEGSIYRYMSWQGYWDCRYIRLTSVDDSDTVSEIAFVDSVHETVLPVRIYEDALGSERYPAELMIDEQDRIVTDPTYYDESFFDEVYHPRNAWEISEGQYMYSTVHPLLGTEMIALSIKLFGNSPLAWRLPGALFGIAMIPLLFHILCLLFRDHRLAWFGIVLFAADFMHITTSRIATLEPMSVFFILLMFDRMIYYCAIASYDVPFRRQLFALLDCGICMGLAISAKWTACYSAVGLAILFFCSLYSRWRISRKFKVWSDEEKHALKESDPDGYKQIEQTPLVLMKTLLWAVLFFMVVPCIIYVLVYLPAHITRGTTNLQAIIDQTVYIYRYHIGLDATHPYQSTWNQWLLDQRPIWYFGRADQSGIYHTIACFSNPLICYGGLLALPLTLYAAIRQRRICAIVILTGFITALAPWLLVDRCVFAYHFYPSSLFLIMAIVCAFDVVHSHLPRYPLWLYGFAAAAVVLFVIYLPVLTGFGTRLDYVHWLEVLPLWYFG